MALRTVPGRYHVRVDSRHPVLGRDYDPVSHRYRDSYVRPNGYRITVDAFPGMTLMINKGDQQHPGRGGGEAPKDIYSLDVTPGTTAFEFTLTGFHEPATQLGPRRRKVHMTGTRPLPTTIGVFTPQNSRNAWNFAFTVPGPGTYTVATRTLRGAARGNPQTHVLEVRDHLVVSIGDSAASGEGNPDVPGQPRAFDVDLDWWEVLVVPIGLYKLGKEAVEWGWNKLKQKLTTVSAAVGATLAMDPPPVWLEREAHRSLLGGHSRGAAAMEDLDAGTVVTYLPFGRSGATIADGLIGPRSGGDAWIGGIGQVEEVKRTVGKKRIDALLIYVGINEVGVTSSLKNLLLMDAALIATPGVAKQALLQAMLAKARASIATYEAQFDALSAELAGLNIRHIYLTEYPTGLFHDDAGNPAAGCGVFAFAGLCDIDGDDARLVQQINEEINAGLRAQARKRGWLFIDRVAGGFAGQGYCSSEPLFVGAEESLVIQGDTEGSVHPNVEGSQVIARRVHAVVSKRTIQVADLGDGRTHGDPGGAIARRGGQATLAGNGRLPRMRGAASRRAGAG